MSDLLTGTRTLDEVPDEDDGDDDSDAKQTVGAIAVIGGFTLAFFAVDAVLFEELIQPLAVSVDPGLAGEPAYDSGATWSTPTNGPARLRDISFLISCILGMLGGTYITEKLNIDGQTDD